MKQNRDRENLMKIFLTIVLMLAAGDASCFEQWEHKRMGDLAYYLAVEIHCSGKDRPEVCASLHRETQAENIATQALEGKCENEATGNVCKIFDAIRAELKKKNKDEDRLKVLNEDLDRECNIETNVAYCERRNYLQYQRWQSTSFFDPVFSGDQLDTRKKYTDEKISYGDVVGCVDYFLTPEKLMAGSETSLYKPLNRLKRYADPAHSVHLYPERRGDLDLSVAKRCYATIWNFEGNRAAHVNHTHFQSELIISQRNMHLLALSLRTTEKNLFGALTANAISDHYLQDSFAPGHITAWRSRLTDVAANAFHDKRNREGMDVEIDAAIISKINAVKVGGVDTTIIGKLLERSDEKTNPGMAGFVRAYFLLTGEVDRNETCGPKKCVALSADEQLHYIEALGKNLLEKRKIKVKGDGFLWDEQQNDQRLVLLITEVRSVLDILQSSLLGQADDDGVSQVKIVDSFRGSNWFWIETVGKDRASGVRFVKPSNLTANIGPVIYEVENSPKIYGYERTDPIYGVSIGFDDMLFGEQQNRSTISVERLIIGNANEKRDAFNLALIGGAQWSHAKLSNSAGLSLRGAFVFPQTETIISIPVRYASMHEGTNKKWRPAVGLRLDQGFTSFSTFYLQVSWDSATQPDGTIRSGMAIGAGLGFAAPECRIPLINSLPTCH
jgi:hypothetical protein